MRHKSFLYKINSFCRSILSVFLNGYLANVRFIVKILKSGLTLLKDSSKIVIKEKEKPVRKPYWDALGPNESRGWSDNCRRARGGKQKLRKEG